MTIKTQRAGWPRIRCYITLHEKTNEYFELPKDKFEGNDVILSSKHDPLISVTSNFLLAHVYSNHRDRPSFCNLHWLELDPDHMEGVRSVASFNLSRKYFRSSFISTINACNGLLAFVVTKNTKSWLIPNSSY